MTDEPSSQWEAKRSPQEVVQAAIEALRKTPGCKWTVETLAKGAGCDEQLFAEAVKLATGYSLTYFVGWARHQEAERLLATTDLPVRDIADRLGHNRGGSFHNHFQRYGRTTPLEYRRRTQGEASPARSELNTHKAAVQRIVAAIRANLEHPWSVNELARIGGYSPRYFVDVVRRVTNNKPRELLACLRHDEAKRLLVITDLSITSIAKMVGYPDASRFSSQFRRLSGMSATQYRRQNQRVPPLKMP